MRAKKKRKSGVQVKKYQHGGYHGDPPYTASADGTYVAMPDLSFLPVLQPLPEEPEEQRPVGPTIGPTTQAAIDAGSKRYEAEKRRREAIARGINPNLAFTMPPGIMGDSQAAAEYQYDNMFTSPIGQIATEFAFTPIGRGLDYVIPRIPSTYLGRQTKRGFNYLGKQASLLGQKAMQFLSDYAMDQGARQILDGVAPTRAGFTGVDDMRIGPQFHTVNPSLSETRAAAAEGNLIFQQRKNDFLNNPVLQGRHQKNIRQQLNTLYKETMEEMGGGTNQGVIDAINANRTGDPAIDGMLDEALKSWNKLSSQVVKGELPLDAPIVLEALKNSNREIKNMTFKPLSAYGKDAFSKPRAAYTPVLDGPQLRAAEQRIEEIGFEIPKAARRGDAEKAMALDAERADLIVQVENSRLEYPRIRLDANSKPVLDSQGNYIYELSSYGGYDFKPGFFKPGQRPNEIMVDPYAYRNPDHLESIIEHEFTHAISNFDPGLRQLVDMRQLETTSAVARDMGNLVPRVRVEDIATDAEAKVFGGALDYVTQAGNPNPILGTRYRNMTERKPMVAETRMRMVQAGAIDDIDSVVTTDDILNFYDKMYGPQQVRKKASQPLMSSHKDADRILELFDPRTPVKDGSGRINADILRDVMNSLPVITAAAAGTAVAAGGDVGQDFRHGGKFKILKKK